MEILHLPEWLRSRPQVLTLVGEDVEQGWQGYLHFSIAGGSANLYNHFGIQFDVFSENWE